MIFIKNDRTYSLPSLKKMGKNFSKSHFGQAWSERSFIDCVNWYPGQLYSTVKEIPAWKHLPREIIDPETKKMSFVFSIEKLMQDHNLTRNQALHKNVYEPLPKNSFFMFVTDHFDGRIFSILERTEIKYVFRRWINGEQAVVNVT